MAYSGTAKTGERFASCLKVVPEQHFEVNEKGRIVIKKPRAELIRLARERRQQVCFLSKVLQMQRSIVSSTWRPSTPSSCAFYSPPSSEIVSCSWHNVFSPCSCATAIDFFLESTRSRILLLPENIASHHTPESHYHTPKRWRTA